VCAAFHWHRARARWERRRWGGVQGRFLERTLQTRQLDAALARWRSEPTWTWSDAAGWLVRAIFDRYFTLVGGRPRDLFVCQRGRALGAFGRRRRIGTFHVTT
jgi:hypothetical protein